MHIPASNSDLTDLIPNLAFGITTHSLSQHERQETGSLTLKLKAIVTVLTIMLNVGFFFPNVKKIGEGKMSRSNCLAMFRQSNCHPWPCPQTMEGQDKRHSQGACVSCISWAGVVPLPSGELPAPTLHSSVTAVLAGWGGTSQIRRNNGLGRGQVRLGDPQKRELHPTHTRTEKTITSASPLRCCWPQFPCFGSLQSTELSPTPPHDGFRLKSRHFTVILAQPLASSSWETGSSLYSSQGPVGQGHAQGLPQSTFPT